MISPSNSICMSAPGHGYSASGSSRSCVMAIPLEVSVRPYPKYVFTPFSLSLSAISGSHGAAPISTVFSSGLSALYLTSASTIEGTAGSMVGLNLAGAANRSRTSEQSAIVAPYARPHSRLQTNPNTCESGSTQRILSPSPHASMLCPLHALQHRDFEVSLTALLLLVVPDVKKSISPSPLFSVALITNLSAPATASSSTFSGIIGSAMMMQRFAYTAANISTTASGSGFA